MTDQPQGPTEPVPTDPTAPPASSPESGPPAAEAAPEQAPAAAPETPAPAPEQPAAAAPEQPAASAPPAPPTPPAAAPAAPAAGPYGAPQPGPYGAPQAAPYGGYGTYGAPGTPGAPGAPAPGAGGYYPNPAAAQQGYPPPANPYGGYAQAPVYAGGGGPAYPGTLAYVEQNYGKVADFGQRALAYLIDVAITLIGLVPMVIGIIMVSVSAASSWTTDQYGNVTSTGDVNTATVAVGVLLIVVGVLVSLGITIWNRIFKMGRTGQSVGKKVIGLYLLDDKTGRPIGAGMCFLRELVQSLVNQIFYIGWLWMLWDADKQTLGDKTVHSSVVVVPKR